LLLRFLLDPVANCRSAFEPLVDFQFAAKSGGIVAERVHVNLDYDTQREFDASNNISIYYEGKRNEFVQRLEVGNVTFQPPSSRYITAGIPSGNYGIQAITKIGAMRVRQSRPAEGQRRSRPRLHHWLTVRCRRSIARSRIISSSRVAFSLRLTRAAW